MADIITKIGYAMSLRKPQQEALSYLDAISTHCDYKKDSKAAIEAAATEYCEKHQKRRGIVTSSFWHQEIQSMKNYGKNRTQITRSISLRD